MKAKLAGWDIKNGGIDWNVQCPRGPSKRVLRNAVPHWSVPNECMAQLLSLSEGGWPEVLPQTASLQSLPFLTGGFESKLTVSWGL